MTDLATTGGRDPLGNPQPAVDFNGMPIFNPSSLSLARIKPIAGDRSFLDSTQLTIPDITFNGGVNPNSAIGSVDSLGIGSVDSLSLGGGGTGNFDFKNALGNFSSAAQGALGLAGAYSAIQQSKYMRRQNNLMEKQLALQTGFANRNLANSAVVTNNSLANQANIASQLTTGADLGTAQQIAAEKNLTRTVDGSPIGA